MANSGIEERPTAPEEDFSLDQTRVEAKADPKSEIVEEIKALLEGRGTRSSVFLEPKIRPGPDGEYVQGRDFEDTGELLGKGNCSERIVTIKDTGTGEDYAMKTMKAAKFLVNEAKAMVHLNDTGFIPKLCVFKVEDDKVKLVMENLREAKTLEVIDCNYIWTLRQKDPELARLFSLCILHDLLECVEEMHKKNWSHCDIHGGNIMLDKDMRIVILDFGCAKPLSENEKFHSDRVKMDVLCTARIYTGLIAGNTFSANWSLEEKIKKGILEEVLASTGGILREDEKKLLEKLNEASDPTKEGYQGIASVKEHVKSMLPEKKEDIMKRAAPHLKDEGEDKDMKEKREARESGAEAEAREQSEEPVHTDDAATRNMSAMFAEMKISRPRFSAENE